MRGRIFLTFRGEGVEALDPALVRKLTDDAVHGIERWVEYAQFGLEDDVRVHIASGQQLAHRDIMTLMQHLCQSSIPTERTNADRHMEAHNFMQQLTHHLQGQIGETPRVLVWIAASIGDLYTPVIGIPMANFTTAQIGSLTSGQTAPLPGSAGLSVNLNFTPEAQNG